LSATREIGQYAVQRTVHDLVRQQRTPGNVDFVDGHQSDGTGSGRVNHQRSVLVMGQADETGAMFTVPPVLPVMWRSRSIPSTSMLGRNTPAASPNKDDGS